MKLFVKTNLVFLFLVQLSQAAYFTDKWNTILETYDDYLYEVDTLELAEDNYGWTLRIPEGWGHVTYFYDLPFVIEKAYLNTNLYYMQGEPFPDTQGTVEVSIDNENWTTIYSVEPFSCPNSHCSIDGLTDITNILYDSTTVYIRANLYHNYWAYDGEPIDQGLISFAWSHGTVNYMAYIFQAMQSLPGDTNFDDEINGLDVETFIESVLASDSIVSGHYNPQADMNEDDVVNGLDVNLFQEAVINGGGVFCVPEPNYILILLVMFYWYRAPRK